MIVTDAEWASKDHACRLHTVGDADNLLVTTILEFCTETERVQRTLNGPLRAPEEPFSFSTPGLADMLGLWPSKTKGGSGSGEDQLPIYCDWSNVLQGLPHVQEVQAVA